MAMQTLKTHVQTVHRVAPKKILKLQMQNTEIQKKRFNEISPK